MLSTLALLISWIPGLDLLSPVLLGLAALASGAALVCNLMLALAGEGSWLDVATDLFALVTFGYGAKVDAAERVSANLDRTAAKETETLCCKGDPVEVAAGRVVLAQTDVELAGVLALVLSRTHLSSYRVGRWFGPSWASTLDQRLEIEDTGVYYAGEDGMLLAYPTPAPRYCRRRVRAGPCAAPRMAATPSPTAARAHLALHPSRRRTEQGPG